MNRLVLVLLVLVVGIFSVVSTVLADGGLWEEPSQSVKTEIRIQKLENTIEKLERRLLWLEAKSDDKRIVCSFWCTFNGHVVKYMSSVVVEGNVYDAMKIECRKKRLEADESKVKCIPYSTWALRELGHSN